MEIERQILMNLQNVNDMKRYIIILISLYVCSLGILNAQNSSSYRYEGKPLPDWILGPTPEPHNDTYYYKVFDGVSQDREEARNLAIKKAFQQAMTFISTTVNSADVFAALESGKDLNVISETFSIPIYFTCECSKKSPDGMHWNYWILCQIAVRGNIVPQFDLHFVDCKTNEIWDKKKEEYNRGIKTAKVKSNARSLVASTFIPGLGQMLKKQGGSGAAFLLSEVVLFGGGTACYFLGQEQVKTMKATGTTYEQYANAKSMKNIYDIAMYTAFGVGAAVHVGNMVHAWVVKDKHLSEDVTLVPVIIPTNEYIQPSYAYGAGLKIKF